jgi:hypothetical protein
MESATERVTVRVPTAALAALRARAQAEDRSVSSVIRRTLTAAVYSNGAAPYGAGISEPPDSTTSTTR